MSCDENYSNCVISCRGSNACFGRQLYCRPTDYVIGQTSGNKCRNCVISCSTDDACKQIDVFTFDCDSVQINALGDKSIEIGKVISPYNGSVYVLASNVFENTYTGTNDDIIFLLDVDFTANNTNYFEFNCDGALGCTNNMIDATYGFYIEFNCLNGANCSYNSIYCPDNALNDGVSCQIYFGDDAVGKNNDYYAIEGLPTV